MAMRRLVVRSRVWWVGLAVVSCCLAWGGEVRAVNEMQIERELRERLPAHPRLLWRPEMDDTVRERIEADEVLGLAWGLVRTAADEMLEVPPVERVVTGRRLLSVSRQCLKRVLFLGTAWRLTGEQQYLDRAQQELLAAAAFPDWNPSHFLDVAEMTAALAIGYDWFHDALDEPARHVIRAAIVEKGLQASYEHRWPVEGRNNWNQVCHAGLVLGALAVAEDEPELAARIVLRAVQNVPRAMEPYEPDGAYPEGPSYWNYGTSFNVLLIAALESVFGHDFGLFERHAGFRRTGDYFAHVTGPTGLYFNYADGGARRSASAAQAWLASRLDRPGLAYNEAGTLRRMRRIEPAGESERLLPLMLIWAERLDDAGDPAALSYLGRGDAPVGLHRSAWNEQSVYVGLKGGVPSSAHGHMDIGQFVLEADGVRWSVDLGADSYHALESRGMRIWGRDQDSERWKVFRYNNLSHSTITVDGQHQLVDGFAPIVRHAGSQDAEHEAHTVIDMSATYAGQVERAWRGVKLLTDGRVLVQDEVRALPDREGETVVRWAMATPGTIERSDAGEAVLLSGDERLHLRLTGLEALPQWKEWSLEPPNEWDSPNRGRRLVGFELALRPGESVRVGVVFTPGTAAEATPPPPYLRALESWSAPLP
jgi:hypothetical protein